MYCVTLCDDEASTLDLLYGYLKEIERSKGLELSIRCCRSGEALLAMPAGQSDLIVLDIGMGGISGMEAARRLRDRGENADIIFLTSMVQYALEGYDVRACAFLPKPVRYETFAQKVVRALTEREQRSGNRLALKCGTEMDYVNVLDILYIDVQDHSLRPVLRTGEAKTYYTKLSLVEQQLEGRGFFRCHKSYLVNHRQIQAIRADHLVISNGDTVPLSKHRRKEFMTDFTRFMGREQTL